MQGIYNYVPETNHDLRVYIVATSLYLQFMALVMLFPTLNVLYFYISTLQSIGAWGSVVVKALRY
jgi:hypothetical protein